MECIHRMKNNKVLKKIYKLCGKTSGNDILVTHSFAYSYRLFKKCFFENYDTS